MRSGKLNSNAKSTARVGAMRVAAARAIAASSPVVPHTPQLEPAEKRRVAVCISMCTSGRRRTLTTLGRRVLDSTASISLAWLTMPSPYSRPTARFSSSPGVLIVVPNDTGSSPSAGWCSMYSSGASPATRSSLSTGESRPAQMMLTFIVPPATGSPAPGAMNSAVLTAGIIALFSFARVFMIKLLSRLPWAALYALSAFLYFLAYYVVRHRDHVIREQLEKVFPDLSPAQRTVIHKQFLRNFCDVSVELLKSVSMSADDMRNRMRVVNGELARQYLDAGQTILFTTSHLGNWEWLLHGVTLQVGDPVDAAYKPLH